MPGNAYAARNVAIGTPGQHGYPASTTGFNVATASGTTTFTPTADDAFLAVGDLQTALASNDVVVNTGATGSQNGDVSVSDPVSSILSTHSLELDAAHNVSISNSVFTGGALKLGAGGNNQISVPTTQISVDSLDATATGNNQIDGNVATNGDQSWGGPTTYVSGQLASTNGLVDIAGDTRLIYNTSVSGDQIHFEGAVDGNFVAPTGLNLALSAQNGVTFSGQVGAQAPLTAVSAGDSAVKMDAAASLMTVSGQVALGGLDISGLTIGPQPVSLASGKSLAVNGPGTISGVIGGSGGLAKLGNGTLVLTAAANNYTGDTTVSGGTLQVDGAASNVTLAKDTVLSGNGTTGAVVAHGATVSPGHSPGHLTIVGGLVMDSDSYVPIDITGTTPFSEFDQITVLGPVQLNGASVDAAPTKAFPPRTSFTVIDNDGSDAVGRGADGVQGFPDGSAWYVNFAGGDGNDVTLTQAPYTATVKLAVAPDALTLGAPVDLTATVTGVSGQPAPTGKIRFIFDGAAPELGEADIVNGVAHLIVPAPRAGDHAFRANYDGDAVYGATSDVVQRHIDDAPAQSAQPPSISVGNAKGKRKRHRKSSITFVLTRSGDTSGSSKVAFATKNGTARAGRDYKPAKGTVTFAVGVKRMTVKVVVLPRKGKAQKRRLALVLSSAQSATLGDAVGTGTIA